jgi:hypothetical protein
MVTGEKSQKITLDDIINLLNQMLVIDRQAITELVNNRVVCNEVLADHPTIVVGERDGVCKVGLLGVLNGLFNKERLCVEIDTSNNEIVEFSRL